MKEFLIVLLLLFRFVPECFASRSLSIVEDKTVVTGDELVTLTASLSGFTTGENIYMKAAMYQDGSTNYFGFTQNGNNWVKSGDSITDQRQIQIGSWDGSLLVKSDSGDSGYKGEGDYKIKVGFYYFTSGGNLSSVQWSTNSVDIHINEPDPTATSVPPSPTPTLSPTPVRLPTPTIVLSNTPYAVKPTKQPVSTISATPLPVTGVLGIDESFATASSYASQKENTKEHTSPLPLICISIGLILVVGCCGTIGYLYVRKSNFLHLE